MVYALTRHVTTSSILCAKGISVLQALQSDSHYADFNQVPDLQENLLGSQMLVLEDLLSDLRSTV